jgi:hypothetical protein
LQKELASRLSHFLTNKNIKPPKQKEEDSAAFTLIRVEIKSIHLEFQKFSFDSYCGRIPEDGSHWGNLGDLSRSLRTSAEERQKLMTNT